jgi:hypothetical protein
VGGCAPKPKKDNPDSKRIAPAIFRVAMTMIGAKTLGKRWRIMILGFETQMARAASTKSCSYIVRILPRTIRAYCAHIVNPKTIMILTRLGGTIATTANINRKEGKDINRSTRLMIKVSTGLPKYPAKRPIQTPTTAEIPAAMNPTVRDTRVPNIILLSTSRPRSSVPKRWLELGGASFSRRCIL